MKTIQGWDQFVADARRDPILVPLWDQKTATVHYPSKRQMKQIFDEQGNLRFDPAVLALFGEEDGQRLLDESEDQQGAPLERMVLTVLTEWGLVRRSVLDQFNTDSGDSDDTDGEEGGDPNLATSSSSSTGTAPNLNGTSPSGSASTSSTSSAGTAPSRN